MATDSAWTYVESSGLLAAWLEGDVEALGIVDRPTPLVASELTLAETARNLLRASYAGRITTAKAEEFRVQLQIFARRSMILPITGSVLDRAGRPFPVEPLRTLDAIHLASLELVSPDPATVAVLTRDRRLSSNSRALGYRVV